MTISHHPTDATLAALGAGTLDEGRSVVVRAHLERCPACLDWVRGVEYLGGIHLQGLAPTALAPNALQEALARLDQPVALPKLASARVESDSELPRALQPFDLGPWRWSGPGVYWRSASVPADRGARVFLLKAAPGTRLPHHTHTGTELTLVLAGAFAHEGGRFAAGDFEEADGSIEHQPVVEAGEECICLVAMEGQLRLLGMIGRILQPFVRF